MNWGLLYDMQQQLDQYIETQHDLMKGEKTEEKMLAFLVELGELANETRCFKFWSVKAPSEKGVIVEEYVDGLHFLLSLGLDIQIRYQPQKVERYGSITEGFLATYAAADDFRKVPERDAYQQLFTSFLKLGETIGLDENEIMEAYYSKNEVNYKRQEEGY
ncbi:dUTP diphosphatase [Halobacillus locisalis]|uniref:dUTP diphosphatase n=1 Tax=Halobacillus locisalis TaxID=220753 RepID=A0A838CMV1_9BACI|nr:dUTP diphosphatase [Halobacillus locisalis]MBA2173380.1 dUTP diphosphatase [Halobacillus locisalis]